jgi:uncharacterized RDD family membrane protein YckC
MYPNPNQPQSAPYGTPPYQQPSPEQPSWQQQGAGQYGQQQYQQPYGQQAYQQPAQAQLQYVGVGPRFLAVLIDAILVGVVSGLLSALLRGVPGVAGLLVAVIAIAYYIGLEATRGATVGKMAMGLRVVKTDGTPISWSESVVRNLLRVVDGLFAYLVGAILIWTSPTKQRLGDRVANTVVIKSRG